MNTTEDGGNDQRKNALMAIEQLRKEIRLMVLRYGQESDVTAYEAIGCLEIVKRDIIELLERKDYE